MRPCPHCGTMISQTSGRCRHCDQVVEPAVAGGDDEAASTLERMVLPVGRPASAIAAGYLGLFSVLPFFGIAAIVVSLVALRTLKRKPHLSGRGRAVFGLFMGVIGTLLYAIPIVMLVISAIATAQGRRPPF